MNVLVIGDYCQDIFVRGKAERLCPEAPCCVLNPVSTQHNDGMAGNVAANVKSLAPDCHMSVVFQPDDIRKTRYVDNTSGYILLRVDENDKVQKPVTYESLIAQAEMYVPLNEKWDIVLFSDYNKGFLTEEVIRRATLWFQQRGAIVFLDTKKILGDWSLYVNFVKINEKEYDQQCRTLADPSEFCRELIVTFGSKGSRRMKTNTLVPSVQVEVADVSGAGDTYFAAFAIRYWQGRNTIDPIQSAMEYANKAAAIAVSKHGVVAVKQQEVDVNY